MTSEAKLDRAIGKRWAKWAWLGAEFQDLHRRRYLYLRIMGLEQWAIVRLGLDDPRLPRADQEALVKEYLDERGERIKSADRRYRKLADAAALSALWD